VFVLRLVGAVGAVGDAAPELTCGRSADERREGARP
jgi:hypothetical protein